MRTPSPSCRRSSPSSLEWRPSRLQAVAQLSVLLATPWLLHASDLPPRLLTPAVLLAWAIGLAELAWRLRRPRARVLLPALPDPLQVAGQDIDAPAWWCAAPGCCCCGVRTGGGVACCSGLMCSIPGSDVNCDWPWPHAAFPVGPGQWHHKLN